ncbi:hypothetical protein GJAV_G00035970 [Gymnothorax javanicus]|nr:hypothetical protein GJAV_G00035970 [Gymnothorax javanicus]
MTLSAGQRCSLAGKNKSRHAGNSHAAAAGRKIDKSLRRAQQALKSHLKQRFERIFEGSAQQGPPTLLNEIYTELYITEGGSGRVSNEHEVRLIETASRRQTTQETAVLCNDIFKPLPGQEKHIRTVLTKGIAGIGKTVSVQKFILDWAEGRANQDIDFIFSLPFRDLNLKKDQEFSLMQLLQLYSPQLKEIKSIDSDEVKVVFIFDGLDECRRPLDFQSNEICCDVTESSSVNVLLTNLIQGNLLPSALLWITSRPAAANQIPPECVHQVTEVRGFSDPQKEEYFRKRIRDQEKASRIISHIKSSRSLYIMCHIPVFCWISAAVLETMLGGAEREDLPKTLTEMYTHFLLIQTQMKNDKYQGTSETNPKQTSVLDTEIILKLGRLAFAQLKKGNLIFYEEDLRESSIDVRAASVYSGVCTEIFKEECGLHQEKEIQGFQRSGKLSDKELLPHQCSALAFVLLTSEEVLDEFDPKTYSTTLADYQRLVPVIRICRKAMLNSCDLTDQSCEIVASALQSSNSPLRDLDLSSNNLGDSRVKLLCDGLMSPNCKLQTLDLSFNNLGDSGVKLLCDGLLSPNCKLQTLGLGWCNLTEGCCDVLASVLRSPHSELRDLELRDNELQDSGVTALSAGLEDPHCKLQRLGLSGCRVTHTGCDSLASALSSNPSHLRELDLSYNHPGDSGVRALSAAKLDTLTLLVDHGGENRTKPGPRKYGCRLTLDPNTANRELSLSEGNRRVTHTPGREQPYPDHPERFKIWLQVLCRESVCERCYWEAEWSFCEEGEVDIAVTDKGIRRRREGDCGLGWNKISWILSCSERRYSILHNLNPTLLPAPPSPYHRAGVCDDGDGGVRVYRVGVCVDRPAGTLSFYRVSDSDTLTLLHTVHTHLPQHTPLCAGFGLRNSSVSLCQLE